MRKAIGLAIALSLPLGLATPGGAVEDDPLQGRVKSKEADTLTIQSRSGEEVRVRTDARTTVRNAHGRLELADVDAGDRVEITASGRRQPLLATEIRLEKLPRATQEPIDGRP